MTADTDPGNAVRLAVELQLGRERVENGDRFIEDLDADSFDLMNVVAILEEDLDIFLAEEAVGAVRTVGELVDLVSSLVGP